MSEERLEENVSGGSDGGGGNPSPVKARLTSALEYASQHSVIEEQNELQEAEEFEKKAA